MRKPVFLSASVPYEKEPGFSVRYGAQPIAVREAIKALVTVVVVERPLVFGGHPAITPLVWEAAHDLRAEEQVYIYQSEVYRERIPPEARFFNNLVWTPVFKGESAGKERDKASVLIMRDWMLELRRLPHGSQHESFVAGVFIGGMDGVEDEWHRFRSLYPGALALPVGSTEGAARALWQNWEGTGCPRDKAELGEDPRYGRVFRRLLAELP